MSSFVLPFLLEFIVISDAINRFTSQGVLERMPVERTEYRGADELYKYYDVYETIGSGNDHVNICQTLTPTVSSFSV